MNNIITNKCDTVSFVEDGYTYFFKADYGINKIGDQEPYFSITSELRNNIHVMVSCGCQHYLVEKHLPHLKELIKWHLVSVDSGPMHYLANAMFWWERSKKDFVSSYKNDTTATGAKAFEHFKSTIVYGCLESDSRFNLDLADDEDVKNWLINRLPDVMKEFKLTMNKYGITVKKSKLIKA